jgi:KDO2-lipid IV(A) lauroyltransferase
MACADYVRYRTERRIWPTWLGLAALRGIELLPYCAQRYLAASLGSIFERLPLRHVHIARRNIELCLPLLSSRGRALLLASHCQGIGMGLSEAANTWWSSDARVGANAEVVGREHLQAALARGRGVIMIGGHFTTIQIATRILGTIVPLNMLYRAPKNELLAWAMRASFARHGNYYGRHTR